MTRKITLSLRAAVSLFGSSSTTKCVDRRIMHNFTYTKKKNDLGSHLTKLSENFRLEYYMVYTTCRRTSVLDILEDTPNDAEGTDI